MADLRTIPVAKLEPWKGNPRSTPAPEGLRQLEASIRENGLMQPLSVRPAGAGRFEVIAGNRRLVACKGAGLTEIPCMVHEDLSDEDAARLAAIENLDREDLSPLDQGMAIAGLVKQGSDVREVARRLGRSLGWVQRRANLVSLSKGWRKALKQVGGNASDLSIELLERVALLPEDEQDGILQELDFEFPSRRMLQGILADLTRSLALAPWDLEDEDLVPKAGSCSRCPKTTLSRPGLFDGLGGEAEKAAAGGSCRDAGCWDLKLGAHQQRIVAAARAEHPEGLHLVAGKVGSGSRGLRTEKSLEGVLKDWQYSKARGPKAKGAQPALVVEGEGMGKVIYIVPEKGRSGRGQGARGKGGAAAGEKPLTPAAQLKAMAERLKRRRLAWKVDEVRGAVEAFKPQWEAPPPALLRAVLAYGTKMRAGGPGPPTRIRMVKGPGEARLGSKLWADVAPEIVAALRRYNPNILATQAREAEAVWTTLLGRDAKALDMNARHEVPEPKTMGALKAKSRAARRGGKVVSGGSTKKKGRRRRGKKVQGGAGKGKRRASGGTR